MTTKKTGLRGSVLAVMIALAVVLPTYAGVGGAGEAAGVGGADEGVGGAAERAVVVVAKIKDRIAEARGAGGAGEGVGGAGEAAGVGGAGDAEGVGGAGEGVGGAWEFLRSVLPEWVLKHLQR